MNMTNKTVEINLDDIKVTGEKVLSKKKTPKLVYCGDGVLEEYSEDEDDDTKKNEPEEEIDASKLDWLPWFKHKATSSASKSLSACDHMGEKLAWWFGITQPKYLYEIEEYKRMKQEEIDNDSDTEEIVLAPKQQPLSSNQLFQA